MKKTVLLSIAASTLIMAGGEITPVEPVVRNTKYFRHRYLQQSEI